MHRTGSNKSFLARDTTNMMNKSQNGIGILESMRNSGHKEDRNAEISLLNKMDASLVEPTCKHTQGFLKPTPISSKENSAI